jgi:hypothetical protein
MKTRFTPAEIDHRNAIEARFTELPKITPTAIKLLSARGFALCFLDMEELYPSRRIAYERLEDAYIRMTGKRRYSSYNSFRRVLGRNLKNGWKRYGTAH